MVAPASTLRTARFMGFAVGLVALGGIAFLFGNVILWIAVGTCLGAVGLVAFLLLAGTRWRPAAFVSLISPFEDVLFTYFGAASHLITPFPVLAFALTARTRLVHSFLGTATQKLVAIFVLSLAPSFISAFLTADTTAFVLYGQKIGLLLLVGVFAAAMLDARRLELIIKVFMISSAVFVLLSMLEFYLSIKVFPSGQLMMGDSGIFGPLESLLQSNEGGFSHHLRLRGLAGSTTPNALASRLQLPFFLCLAWFATGRSFRDRATRDGAFASASRPFMLCGTR